MITQLVIILGSLALGWMLRDTVTTRSDKVMFMEIEIRDRIIDELMKMVGKEEFEKAATKAVDKMSEDYGVEMKVKK